jgi:hypothetical protein
MHSWFFFYIFHSCKHIYHYSLVLQTDQKNKKTITSKKEKGNLKSEIFSSLFVWWNMRINNFTSTDADLSGTPDLNFPANG